ncbi:MAG: DUF7305 domain-containing protein [Planctomycetota bacterium]
MELIGICRRRQQDELIWDQGTPGATTGPRYSLPSAVPFDPMPPPTVYHATGVNLSGSDLEIAGLPVDGYTPLAPYTVETSSIDITDTMSVVGHVAIHVTGDMTLSSGASLLVGQLPSVDPADPPPIPSSLAIYLDGDLEGKTAGGINNLTGIPVNFILYGTGTTPLPQRWVIKNSLNFYGVYDAPNAIIIVHNEGDIFGSVSGKSFDLRNSGMMHYDVQLSELIGTDVGFGIDRWWEEVGPPS